MTPSPDNVAATASVTTASGTVSAGGAVSVTTVAAGAGGGATVVVDTSAATVTISTLPSLLANGVSVAESINNAGQAVGAAGSLSSGGFTMEACLWQGGPATGLDGMSGDTYTVALGINDAGLVVGGGLQAGQPTHGLIWQDGTATLVGTLGGAFSEAVDVNNSGTVVGDSSTADNFDEAFLWQNGKMTKLGTLPGGDLVGNWTTTGTANSIAWAINDAGQVVGYSLTSSQLYHAFSWQNGVMTDLGALSSGSKSYARAINDSGEVVGYNYSASGVTHAVAWKSGVIADLGTLSGGSGSMAESVNLDGVIAGYATTSSYAKHAVIWENGLIIDLNSLLPTNSGWVLTDAHSINDKGQIVGDGTLSGVSTSFELTLGPMVASSPSAQSAIKAFQTGLMTTPVTVSDSAADVQTGLDGLASLLAAGKLAGVTLSDAGTPSLTLSATQVAQDKAVLQDISGSYTLSISGFSASVATFVQQQKEAYLPGTSHATSSQVVGFQNATFTSGSNAVVLDGARSHYLIQVDGTGHLVVKDGVTQKSIAVTGDSYIIFDGAAATTPTVYDQAVFIASGTNAANDASLARMYQATVGRLPDLQGFESWRAQLDAGNMTTEQIAQSFVTSSEFQARYGTDTTDLQFVDALYTNVLGRSADTSGEAGWVSYLGALTTQLGQTAARATLLLASATSGEEVAKSASWLVDTTTGGTADSGLLLSAATVLNQAETNHYLNTGLIAPSTIGGGVTTSSFQLTGGTTPSLTITATAPAETLLLSAGVTTVTVRNVASTITAGTGNDVITIDGGGNTTVNLGNAGVDVVHVLGGVDTTITGFNAGSGSLVDVTNGVAAANIAILDGSQTAVPGSGLTFGAASALVVNVGALGDGSTAGVVAAINKAYQVADLAGEHVTFMGADSAGNTEFWFFGSTLGAAAGHIPAASLTASADSNGNHLVDAGEITHVATLVGVAPAALTAADLA